MGKNDLLPIIIRQAREEQGYTQEQLSRLIQKSDKYIGAVECGRIMPPYPILKNIICVLGIDANLLFYDNASPNLYRTAELCLRKMNPSRQKLAIDILRVMANPSKTNDIIKSK